MSDGDVLNGNSDPWFSAFPEETVMAYKSPILGFWPDFFSDNDLNALIEVWGAERQFLGDSGVRFDGRPYREIVQGGVGADQISGAGGFDDIVGGTGDDELRGGRNADEVRGGSGNEGCLAVVAMTRSSAVQAMTSFAADSVLIVLCTRPVAT